MNYDSWSSTVLNDSKNLSYVSEALYYKSIVIIINCVSLIKYFQDLLHHVINQPQDSNTIWSFLKYETYLGILTKITFRI